MYILSVTTSHYMYMYNYKLSFSLSLSPSLPLSLSLSLSPSSFATGSCDGSSIIWRYTSSQWTSIVLLANIDQHVMYVHTYTNVCMYLSIIVWSIILTGIIITGLYRKFELIPIKIGFFTNF